MLGNAALSFGPPEFLAFMILAFVLLAALSAAAPLKGALMIALGLFLNTIPFRQKLSGGSWLDLVHEEEC